MIEREELFCPSKYVELSINCHHKYEERILGRKRESERRNGMNNFGILRKSELIITKFKEFCDFNEIEPIRQKAVTKFKTAKQSQPVA